MHLKSWVPNWVCRSTCEREGGEIRERDETWISLEALPNELKLNVSAYKTKERTPINISLSLSRLSSFSLPVQHRDRSEEEPEKRERSAVVSCSLVKEVEDNLTVACWITRSLTMETLA